jgi:hypothetical protein
MTDQSHAQTQTATSTTTAVFALLEAKPGVTRERIMAIMPAEIRATVQLYLEGKIREWYSREDGKGGVWKTFGKLAMKISALRRPGGVRAGPHADETARPGESQLRKAGSIPVALHGEEAHASQSRQSTLHVARRLEP